MCNKMYSRLTLLYIISYLETVNCIGRYSRYVPYSIINSYTKKEKKPVRR